MGIPLRVKTDEDMLEFFDYIANQYELKGKHGLSSAISLEKEYFLACKDLSVNDWKEIRTPLFYKHTSPIFCDSRMEHIIRVLAFVNKYKGRDFNLKVNEIISRDKKWENFIKKWTP